MADRAFIVRFDPFVATDLQEILLEEHPLIDVRVFPDIPDLDDDLPSPDLILVRARVDQLEAQGRAARWQERGARIVVLDGGEKPIDRDRTGWSFVEMPFDAGRIKQALNSL